MVCSYMWNKHQIQALKEKAYSFSDDNDVRTHLTAMNVHLNKYERMFLIHKKNEEWKEVEREANGIKARLTALNVELPSLN